GDLEAEQLLVEQRAVSLDVAGFLQRPHPPQAGRCRDADPARQLHIGDSPVLLQFAQDMAIDVVETGGHDGLRGLEGSAAGRTRAPRPLSSRKPAAAKDYCAGTAANLLRWLKAEQPVKVQGCVSCIACRMAYIGCPNTRSRPSPGHG